MSNAQVKTDLVVRLDIQGPLIQAPMAGGATTPELVAAVSNAGALGSLGGAYLGPDELAASMRKIKALTRRPFAVNLFAPCPQPDISRQQIETAVEATRIYRSELGIADPEVRPPYLPDFEEQFSVVLAERPAVFSFTFGVPDRRVLQECRERGIFTIGTATTVDDGLTLQDAGADAAVAQGAEAGAQRGSFAPEKPDPFLGLTALVPMLASTLRIPVIAAGGIMNGRGIASALALGAAAAQLGTAFLACEECGIATIYRDALLDPGPKTTRLTRAFTGRWARGLENRLIVEMAAKDTAILPFPAQNAFTQDIRKKAVQLGRPEYLSLWAGQGVGLIRAMKTETLVKTLFQETANAIASLRSSGP